MFGVRLIEIIFLSGNGERTSYRNWPHRSHRRSLSLRRIAKTKVCSNQKYTCKLANVYQTSLGSRLMVLALRVTQQVRIPWTTLDVSNFGSIKEL